VAPRAARPRPPARIRPPPRPRSARRGQIFSHPPIQGVGDVDLVLGADRQKMRFAELAERLSLLAHGAEHVALAIELEHLAGVAVRKPEVLLAVDEQPAGRAGKLPFALILTLGIEHLNALIVAVGDVEKPAGVDGD